MSAVLESMRNVVPLSGTLGLRGRLLRVAWDLPADITQGEWAEAGKLLGKIEHSASWWLGDWWAFGEARYGQRKALVQSGDWDGPSMQTCADAASVCRAFEVSRRREVLSFKHHREVLGLSLHEADLVLSWAEEPIAQTGKPRPTREVRAEVSRRRVTIGEQPSSDTCTVADLHALAASSRRFGCIYSDPPWLYDNQGTRAAAGNHYLGLTVDQLCDLPIKQLAADDAHLHLWTTNAFLFDAPRIFAAWGFEYRSSLIWVKPQMGIGNYWRNSHEFLLTAIRGNAKRFNDHSLMSWLECDRGAHSAKPEQIRSMLEKSSAGPYLEMFGRRVAPGWTVWGNQIERSIFHPSETAA